MSLDFQQVRQQVNSMGETAPQRFQELRKKQNQANEILNNNAIKLEALKQKVVSAYTLNNNIRCAVPFSESLDFHKAVPIYPGSVTVIAADGSQINPNRNSAVDFCLVNVGAIQMELDDIGPPHIKIHTELIFDDQMYTSSGRISEGMVALKRDLGERELLADLAKDQKPPIITLTDGPLELWVGRDESHSNKEFEMQFLKYLGELRRLHSYSACPAGYIDQPRSDLVVRLLEIATLPNDEMDKAGLNYRPFLGVTDADLFADRLLPGERSAVFTKQSRYADKYAEDLALHFFYINVDPGENFYYPVRVEIPRWVADDNQMLDVLHAVLVRQCKIMGTRTYPYLLHRSHEVAVVTQDERKQVERMIALEMYRRGMVVRDTSHKQKAKDLAGRARL